MNFYPPDCITKLHFHFNRPALKYSYSHDTQNIIKKKKFYIFFSPSITMSGKSINFVDKKIKKSNFYKNKKLFKIENIDISKILVSKEW